MDSIFDILKDKEFSEPAEVESLKDYIFKNFGLKVSIMVRQKDFVIIVPSSTAAASLRLNSQEINKSLKLTKPLSFRIQA
jgi:hypothetical protein